MSRSMAAPTDFDGVDAQLTKYYPGTENEAIRGLARLRLLQLGEAAALRLFRDTEGAIRGALDGLVGTGTCSRNWSATSFDSDSLC